MTQTVHDWFIDTDSCKICRFFQTFLDRCYTDLTSSMMVDQLFIFGICMLQLCVVEAVFRECGERMHLSRAMMAVVFMIIPSFFFYNSFVLKMNNDNGGQLRKLTPEETRTKKTNAGYSVARKHADVMCTKTTGLANSLAQCTAAMVRLCYVLSSYLHSFFLTYGILNHHL